MLLFVLREVLFKNYGILFFNFNPMWFYILFIKPSNNEQIHYFIKARVSDRTVKAYIF